MPPQNGNGGRGGPWGTEAKPGSGIEDRSERARTDSGRVMQSGGPAPPDRPCCARSDWFKRMDCVLHGAERLVAVVQRFGKYLKEVPPGLHLSCR